MWPSAVKYDWLAALTLAQVTQPGSYTAQISFEQDTPYDVSPVNVTMNVTPPGDWGKIAGTLSGENCQQVTAPLRGIVVADGRSGAQFTVSTGTDSSYAFWAPVGDNPFSLTGSASGWNTVTAMAVMKGAGRTTTVNITLRPPAC